MPRAKSCVSRSHKLVLKEDEEQARVKIESAFEQAGLAVPALARSAGGSGVEAGARAFDPADPAAREQTGAGQRRTGLSPRRRSRNLRELLALRKGRKFRVPEFKEWTGISRKYAIPLLEFLDREQVTRREGDQRVVL